MRYIDSIIYGLKSRHFKNKMKKQKQEGISKHRRLTCPSRRLSKLIKDKSDKTAWYQIKPRENSERDNPIKRDKNRKVRQPEDLRKIIS